MALHYGSSRPSSRPSSSAASRSDICLAELACITHVAALHDCYLRLEQTCLHNTKIAATRLIRLVRQSSEAEADNTWTLSRKSSRRRSCGNALGGRPAQRRSRA